MLILDRYIGRAVVASIFTVLFVLLGIFAFFDFIDELEDLGRGNYGLLEAVHVVVLGLPGLGYQLFPIAALIGSLLGLGALAERNEIAVVRAAGVSRLRVMRAVMQAGLLVALFAALIGEFVYPVCERWAQEVRLMAQGDRVVANTERGFWARDGNNYINIGEVHPDGRFKNIRIFEFGEDNQLRLATAARSASYIDNAWQLEGISRTQFEHGQIVSDHADRAQWESILNPDLIGMVALNPEALALLDLLRYVEFIKRNGQNSQIWEHAAWSKMGYPLASMVMVFLAIPLVLGTSRSSSSGRRILLGALIGLAFHVLNQASGHLGVVFTLAPAVSALGPTLLIFGLGLIMHQRLR